MSSNVAVESAIFRAACGKFATGVTVVTVIGTDGLPYGMTANSFTSVSLDPPLILVCVDRKATMLPRLESAATFGVNVLAEHQRNLSSHFAKHGHNGFEGVDWFRGESGVPLLPDVLATFECDPVSIVDAGDHRVFLGDARYIHYYEGRPLLYFASGYKSLAG